MTLDDFIGRLIAAVRFGSLRTLQRHTFLLTMLEDRYPQLRVMMNDVLAYAADNAWPQAEVLCRFFVDIQDPKRVEHFYWLEDVDAHLKSAAKAASSNKNQVKEIIEPLVAEAERQMSGFITPQHSLTREIFTMSPVEATMKVASTFSRLNETFKDGSYEVSVYNAASMLKSLKLIWACKLEG